MICLMSRVFERRENVLLFQIGIIREDLLERRSGAQQFQHVGYAHSQPANAGTPAALGIINGDPAQAV